MKMITRSILVNLALLGLVVCGRVAGAEEVRAGAGRPAATEIRVGPVSPADPNGFAVRPAEIPAAAGDPTADEYLEVSPDSAVDPAQPALPSQPVSLDGGMWEEGPSDLCCAVCGGGDCCPPTWYTVQEVRIMSRNWPEALGLTYEDEFIGLDSSGNPVFTPRPVLTARAAAFDVAAGYAVTLGRYLGRDSEDRDRFLEFSYWGLNDWRESRAVTGERLTDSTTFAPNTVTFGSLNSGFDPATGAPSISFPFVTVPTTTFNSPVAHSILLPVGGFNRADQQQISYHSNINNFELNLRFRPRHRPDRLVLYPNGQWRRECRPGRYVSYLFGFRVMSVDETFDWRSRGSFEVDGFPFSEVSAEYFVRTRNDLVGLQFGADLIYRRCKWSGGFRGKVSPCINFANQDSRGVTDATGDPYASIPLDFRTSARRDDLAFIGEFGIVGTYSVRPNLILRASYDLMWVAGLALASEQITFQTDPPDAIDTFGLNFYQGLSLGFEWLW